MSLRRTMLLVALPMLVVAGGSGVNTDFDPDVDFKAYSTYSFVPGLELSKTGLLSDPSVRDRIKNFISGALDERGLMEVPRDQNHTLAVRYWVALEQKTDETVVLNNNPGYYGGYPLYWSGAWAWSYEEYVVQDYVQGTLVVDLIDTASKQLIWRTYLRQKIEDRTEAYEEASKNLRKSFADFPPSDAEVKSMAKERARLEKRYKQ
jgi:Domain of unknown function (DUF4136)